MIDPHGRGPRPVLIPLDRGSIRMVQGLIPLDRDRSARCRDRSRTIRDRPTIDPHGARVDPRSIPVAEDPDHDRSLLDQDRSTIDRARPHGSHMLVSKIWRSTRPRPSTGIDPRSIPAMQGSVHGLTGTVHGSTEIDPDDAWINIRMAHGSIRTIQGPLPRSITRLD